MTEEAIVEEQVVEAPKPEPKKPSFKRASSSDGVVETKQPSFKRAKIETAPQTEVAATPIVQRQLVVSQTAVPTITPKADLESITSMIDIRNYVNNLVNGNFTVEKSKMHDLQKISLLLDRKIVDLIVAPEFKSFVKFEDAQKVIQAAAKTNNIRSSLYG